MTQAHSGVACGVLMAVAVGMSGPAWPQAADHRNPGPQPRIVIVPSDAMAADVPVLKAPPLRVYDWSGSYVGFHVGLGNASSGTAEAWDWRTNFPSGALVGVGGGPLVTTTTASAFDTRFTNHYGHSSAGLLGGLQLGHNWQVGRVVFGVEGDVTLTTQGDTVTYGAQPVPSVFPPLPNFFFVPGTTQGWMSEQKINWFTTWRARLGWADNDTLWYLTGGLAGGEIDTNVRLFSTPGNGGRPTTVGPVGAGTFAQFGLPGGQADQSFHSTRLGWALGGGLETTLGRIFGWPVDSRWTLKGEYLFVDLGKVNYAMTTALVPVCAVTCTNPATGSTTFAGSSHVYEQIVRIGVNYRFDAEPQPLPAAAAMPTARWSGSYAGFNVGAAKDSSREADTWDWNTRFPAGTQVGFGGGPLLPVTAATNVTTRFSDQFHHAATGFAGGFEVGHNWQLEHAPFTWKRIRHC